MRQLAERSPSVRFRFAGELIKHTRQKMGLSQKFVAYKANMTPSGLSKVESGKNLLPRNVFQLSDVLKIDPRVLASFNSRPVNNDVKTLDDFKKEFPNWKDLLKEGIKEII